MTETRTLNTAARRLLDGANIAHLSTLQPDGAPKAEPVWVLRDGDFISSPRREVVEAATSLRIPASHCPSWITTIHTNSFWCVARRGNPRRSRACRPGRDGEEVPGSRLPTTQMGTTACLRHRSGHCPPYNSPLIDPRANAHEEERP